MWAWVLISLIKRERKEKEGEKREEEGRWREKEGEEGGDVFFLNTFKCLQSSLPLFNLLQLRTFLK